METCVSWAQLAISLSKSDLEEGNRGEDAADVASYEAIGQLKMMGMTMLTPRSRRLMRTRLKKKLWEREKRLLWPIPPSFSISFWVESSQPAHRRHGQLQMTCSPLSNQNCLWICNRGGKKDQNFQGSDFFLKNALKWEVLLYLLLTLYIFVHIVRGHLFLIIAHDQTNLWSFLCPISDYMCNHVHYNHHTEEKETLFKKKQNLIPSISVTFFVCFQSYYK